MWRAEQPAIGMGVEHANCLVRSGSDDQRAARTADEADGTSREWRSEALPRYARMTRQVEALIAGAYLSGTNTRRVRRALGALFKGAVGKDVVSRTWRKVQTDWQAWCQRSLADEAIVRLVLDGTVVRVRLDQKATSISFLVVFGVRQDGQKVLLECATWAVRAKLPGALCLTTLYRVACDRRTSDHRRFGGAGEGARRGVARTLLSALHGSQAPQPSGACARRLHEEVLADYTDMIYARDRRRSSRVANPSSANGD